MLQALLDHFRLLAVFALLVAGGLGVPVPEELVQLTAGYLARRGVLPFWPALAAAWLGIVLGDTLFFLLARRHGPRLLASRRVAALLTPARRAFLERHFARHAVLTIMAARHASGFRLPAFALAAAHGVRPAVFILADGLSALASVPLVLSLGWYFAARLEEVKRDLHEVELLAGLVVVVALPGWWAFHAWRDRRAAREASGGDGQPPGLAPDDGPRYALRPREGPSMATQPRPWTVAQHDPIEILDENLWAVNGVVPDFPAGTGMNRRMSIVRLGDGRLVFHNAVPIDDASLARVTAWGKPSILIVPMHLHALDAWAFRERLGLSAFTCRTSADKVRTILPIAGTFEDLPRDPALRCEPLAGTRFGECAWVVQSGPRRSLLFCDAFQNNRPGTGFNGFMFKLMGFTGPRPKTPPFFKLRAVTDRGALKRDLLRLAATEGLCRLVPSHGLIVDRDAPAVLRAAVEEFL